MRETPTSPPHCNISGEEGKGREGKGGGALASPPGGSDDDGVKPDAEKCGEFWRLEGSSGKTLL